MNNIKYVLIACEESQTAVIEFRKKGLIAFSCDIQPFSAVNRLRVLQEQWLNIGGVYRAFKKII